VVDVGGVAELSLAAVPGKRLPAIAELSDVLVAGQSLPAFLKAARAELLGYGWVLAVLGHGVALTGGEAGARVAANRGVLDGVVA
jgi:hypothetical protein